MPGADPAGRLDPAGPPSGQLPVRGVAPGAPEPAREHLREHTHAPDSAPVRTGSGLPVRTRVASAGTGGPDTGRNRTVDPEELRRRLGGFQRGAREGHRDAALAASGEFGPGAGEFGLGTGEFPGPGAGEFGGGVPARPVGHPDQVPGQGPGEGPGEGPGRYGEEQPS